MRLLRAVLLLPLLAGCSAVSPPAGSAVRPAEETHAAAPPSRPVLRTYQCLFEDKLVHLRAATVDRSGQKLPVEVLPDGSGDPVGLAWEDAPAGMDYHEEILGSWQGRRILLSSYHWVSPIYDNRTEEYTHCLLSCEDSEKTPRPFLMIPKDEAGIIDLKCELKPFSTQPTGLSASWLYSGSGVESAGAEFTFGPDGPRLVRLSNVGRHMPLTIRTYNSAGRLVKTHTESDS